MDEYNDDYKDVYNDEVNKYLDYSKMMIRQINHIKGSDDLVDLQAVVFAGMIAYYGIDYLDDIYMAFLKCNFVPVDEPLEKVIRDKYGLSTPAVSQIIKHCPGTFYDVVGQEFVNKKTRRRKYKFDRTIYVQDDGSIDSDDLIRSVTHQMNHVINSIHNPIVVTFGSGGLASRSGVSYELLASRSSEGYGLESSFNSLQTNEIVNEILGFSFFDIKDPDMKKILDDAFCAYDKKGGKDGEYDELTEIVKPLYSSITFNPILVENRIAGSLKAIESEFDSKTEQGGYWMFRLLCDKVSDPRISPLISSENKEKAKCYVKQYVANCVDGCENSTDTDN